MTKSIFLRKACKMLLMLVVSIALTRFSKGLWIGVMTLIGAGWALSGKTGLALATYLMIVFMVDINPIILAPSGMFSILVRFAPLIIGLVLMLKGLSYHGHSKMPLGFLNVYLCLAAVSSLNGWAPVISYLKLINFIVFFLGLWLGLHSLAQDREEVVNLRAAFLAFAMFIIFGSLMLIPFPGISTLSGFQLALRVGNVAISNAVMKDMDMMVPLFCGVTVHSQALAPILGCVVAWLIADMLFVEQRFERLHLVLIVSSVPLLYMTSSRAGLFTLMVGVIMVAIWLPKKIIIPIYVKAHLKKGVFMLLLLGVLIAAISEVRSRSMTRWLRKTSDIEADRRSLTEAVTDSRQGVIEESMHDFRRNPLFGSGFQVSEEIADMVARSDAGLVLSAPIEKGLLPVMILGETGILGCIFFGAFLVSFYITANKRRLYVSVALFTVLLATNMAEATFFSPGGSGGILWTICIVGGYSIDTILENQRMISAGI